MTDRKCITSFGKQAGGGVFVIALPAVVGLRRQDHACECNPNLSQRKAPCVIFERVLYRSQLCELREVRKRLQLVDDLFQLLLIFDDEEPQQAEHLQTSHHAE